MGVTGPVTKAPHETEHRRGSTKRTRTITGTVFMVSSDEPLSIDSTVLKTTSHTRANQLRSFEHSCWGAPPNGIDALTLRPIDASTAPDIRPSQLTFKQSREINRRT